MFHYKVASNENIVLKCSTFNTDQSVFLGKSSQGFLFKGYYT